MEPKFYKSTHAQKFYDRARKKFPIGIPYPWNASPGDIVGCYSYITDENKQISKAMSRNFFVKDDADGFDFVNYKDLSRTQEPIAAMLSMRMDSVGVEHTSDFYSIVDRIRRDTATLPDKALQYRLAVFQGFSFVSAADDDKNPYATDDLSDEERWDIFKVSHNLIVDTPQTSHEKVQAITALQGEATSILLRKVVSVQDYEVSLLDIKVPDINFFA